MTQKMSLERGLLVVMVVCALALAVVGGQTLKTDALAVVIGVVVGLVASVPVALLLVALLNPKGRAAEAGPVAEARPQPVEAPAAPAVAQGVRVDLGLDEGGIQTGIIVGARGAEHVLVVRAPEVMKAILLAAGRSGWNLDAANEPADLAELVLVCQRRKPMAARLKPTLVSIAELDDVLEGPEAHGAEELHYLLAHGAAAGLHVVAATQHPDLASGHYPLRICGPLSDPGDLVLALGITLEEADGLTGEGLCWLRAKGNNIGFRAEVG